MAGLSRLWSGLRAYGFATPWAGLLTLVLGALLLWLLPPLVRWSLWDAVWSADPAACDSGGGQGACWGFLRAQGRLLLFGLYPAGEVWRAAAVVGLAAGCAAWAAWPKYWRSWHLAILFLALAAMPLLLGGGVAGLSSVPAERWGGLPLTLLLTLCGEAAALPLAILLALGRRSSWPLVRLLCGGFVELFRGVPLISVLFMASLMIPLLLPGGVEFSKLLRAQIGIALFSAAYLAEIVRGGLQSIPAGQGEAAQALGLSRLQSLRAIILPQALRRVVPALFNSFIAALKDTSLVTVIGLFDLMGSTNLAIADPLWRDHAPEGLLATAALYGLLCSIAAWVGGRIERETGGIDGKSGAGSDGARRGSVFASP